MNKLQLQPITGLAVEKNNFSGISIPFYRNNKYGVVDLDAYEQNLLGNVRQKVQEDAGLLLQFKGFVTLMKLDERTNVSPDAVPYYNNSTKKFVFKVGDTYFSTHSVFSAMYNDDTNNSVRKDKTYLCRAVIYAYDEIKGGLEKISETEILDTTGERTDATMGQKAITDAINAAKKDAKNADDAMAIQINKIFAKNAKMTVKASPNVIYKDVVTPVKVDCTITGLEEEHKSATTISLNKDGQRVASKGGFVLSYTDNVAGRTTYDGIGSLKGLPINGSCTVYAEYPIYVGNGKVYTDVAVEKFKQKPRISVTGSYNITTAANDKVFILVPSNLSVTEAYVGKLNMPYSLEGTHQIGGVSYKVYASDVFAANSFTITLKG